MIPSFSSSVGLKSAKHVERCDAAHAASAGAPAVLLRLRREAPRHAALGSVDIHHLWGVVRHLRHLEF